jgi:hypothetical protein
METSRIARSPQAALEAPLVPPVDRPTGAPYEFNTEQNRLMGTLGNCMAWMGIFLIVVGALGALIGIWQLIHGRASAPIVLIQATLQLMMGFWTRAAAVQFTQVAATTGADIQHLMGALGELRRIYSLQKIVIIMALALMAGAVVIALLAAPAR